MEKGTPIPVVITAYQDRSFTFEMKHAAGVLLPQEGGRRSKAARKTPGRDVVGKVTKAQVREIAEKKMKDLNCDIDRGGHDA